MWAGGNSIACTDVIYESTSHLQYTTLECIITYSNSLNYSIWSVAYKPDGTELLVAAGNRVLVYEGSDGQLLQALKGEFDRL